jgi:hypothetical protein
VWEEEECGRRIESNGESMSQVKGGGECMCKLNCHVGNFANYFNNREYWLFVVTG